MRNYFFALLLFAVWYHSPIVVLAQDDDDDESRPGLILAQEANGHITRRLVGQVDVPFTKESPQSSDVMGSQTWTGSLLLKSEETFQFHAYLVGKLTVRVGDDVVLDATTDRPQWVSGKPVALTFGEVPFMATYRPDPQREHGAKLYWSGDSFPLEPLPHHALFHSDDSSSLRLARLGAQQLEAANCGGCHSGFDEVPRLPRYSLAHVGSGRSWQAIRERLMRREADPEHGRMPVYGLSEADANAVVAYLAKHSQSIKLPAAPPTKAPGKDEPSGRELIKSVGCLACHEWQGVGQLKPLGGGKLDEIAARRTPGWLDQWLAEPAKINPQHRMPSFALSRAERGRIVEALVAGHTPLKEEPTPKVTDDLVQRGGEIIQSARCVVCHEIPGDAGLRDVVATSSNRDRVWQSLQDPARLAEGCLGDSPDPDRFRPSFPHVDARAIVATLSPESGPPTVTHLERLGCVNCHDRDGHRGLSNLAVTLLRTEPQWQGQTPTLSPPPLTAVGDRLLDESLAKAVRGELPVRLNWLRVRMPKFHADQVAEIPALLIAEDRIPDNPPATPDYPVSHGTVDPEIMLAGRELTGGKGFSCVACHQLKDYVPPKVALGTRGSDLYQLGKRMREPYFFRWTRAPLRMLPGVEMPSYQRPHPTILGGDIQRQLAAIWDALHDPQFQAPTNPAVVEQLWGPAESGEPRVIRDVFTLTDEEGKTTYLPHAWGVGFANRHNVLFDMEHASVRTWTLGDFARQRTQGKSWFWDLAGVPVAASFPAVPDLFLLDETGGELIAPESGWTPKVRFLGSEVQTDNSLAFEYLLEWSHPSVETQRSIRVRETWRAVAQGWQRRIDSSDLPSGTSVWLRRPRFERPFGEPGIEVSPVAWTRANAMSPEGARIAPPVEAGQPVLFTYLTHVAPPQVATADPLPGVPVAPEVVTCIPGFAGLRLPLPRSIMPTAFAWNDSGELYFTSLKGSVYRAIDTDQDGLSDRAEIAAEGLAAPFGLYALGQDLLVAHKPEVVRLKNCSLNGQFRVREVVASGWGLTEDYHDWTCGIVRDSAGLFYVGLGSDYTHKNRPASESLWRGNILRFDLEGHIEPFATGLRYPTGLAMDEKDRLFVSDQQGVQNTFNELNYIRPGGRYGVLAQLDPRDDQTSDPPAVQIPHPWTRSVNGLTVWPENGHPFAGQILGTEYNERFLVRASVEEVRGVVQGAVYPLNPRGSTNGREELLGPMSVAFGPDGCLYVGSIHDSGWLGGLNTGDIVRLVPHGDLPNGIREIRATADGFEIEFLQSVNARQASDPAHYQLSGYTRIWEGNYATPDSGRHTPTITSATLSPSGTTVDLRVTGLKEGFVYDFTVGDVAPGSKLWPSVASYTLHRRP